VAVLDVQAFGLENSRSNLTVRERLLACDLETIKTDFRIALLKQILKSGLETSLETKHQNRSKIGPQTWF
jgi:hypothetical protein